MPRNSKGAELKAELKSLGITAVALARAAKLHANTVYHDMKKGRVRPQVAEALRRLKAGAARGEVREAVARAHAGDKAKRHKQQAEVVGNPNDQPAAFEHTDPRVEYDRVAKRISDAVTELNAALKEAHKRADMRVFIGMHRGGDGTAQAAQLGYHIYRLTHSIITYAITESEPTWRQVKDPRFKDAAGEGLAAIERARQDSVAAT